MTSNDQVSVSIASQTQPGVEGTASVRTERPAVIGAVVVDVVKPEELDHALTATCTANVVATVVS
jgi:hypothetical protein